jgi:hypothetical protein
LNDDEAGGIVGSAMGGKIKIDNTLTERLKILEQKVVLILILCYDRLYLDIYTDVADIV